MIPIRSARPTWPSSPRGGSASKLPPGFFIGPPDLAVEVLSPDDRAGEVLAKVPELARRRLGWVADPRIHTVTVYRSRSDIVVLGESETLGGGDRVPISACRWARFFKDSAQGAAILCCCTLSLLHLFHQ